MTFLQIETEINASVELVWATLRDIERWPEWTPAVTSGSIGNPRKIGPGERSLVVSHRRQGRIQSPRWRSSQVRMSWFKSDVVTHRSKKANWPFSRTWRAASRKPVIAAR